MDRIFNNLYENRKLPMLDEQLSDLGVDCHQFDIRTGTISSPSVTSYFLPRGDFPDVLDSDLADSIFFQAASWSEVPSSNGPPLVLKSFQLFMFPDMMTDGYHQFAIAGSDVSWNEFYAKGFAYRGWVVDPPPDYAILSTVRNAFSLSHIDFEVSGPKKLKSPLDSLTCHKHKGHQCSVLGLDIQEKCGEKRPSSMELYAIASLTYHQMIEVNSERSHNNLSNECYFTFPNLGFLVDNFGGCRIFQSYFDGKLHVQFSETLDLGHMIAVPAYGERYFDLVDRKDFLMKLNLLLKWAWPIPQGNTVATVPRICDNCGN